MINSIYELPQTVALNDNVMFLTDAVRTNSASCCGWLQHEQGSGQFTLTNSGIYEIIFNANITSATTGALALVFKSNGETLLGSEMDYTVETANVYQNVSASRLVKICNNASKTITVSNITSNPMLVKNANIIIKKVA